VTFLDGADSPLVLEALVFQNFYTASISINMQTSPTTFVPILENHVIMEDPYSEENAQSSVTILASSFNERFEKGKSLRITLVQPSTLWNSFEIRQLVAIAKPVAASVTTSLGSKRNSASPLSRGMAESSSSAPTSFKSMSALTACDLSVLTAIVKSESQRRDQQHAAAAAVPSSIPASSKTSRRSRAPRKQQQQQQAAVPREQQQPFSS